MVEDKVSFLAVSGSYISSESTVFKNLKQKHKKNTHFNCRIFIFLKGPVFKLGQIQGYGIYLFCLLPVLSYFLSI